MTKAEIKRRVKGLNDCMLSETDKKLLVLSISNDYTYNKAIALVDKKVKDTDDWYAIDYKNCFKTWNEANSFLDGLCLAKNTDFNNKGDLENER